MTANEIVVPMSLIERLVSECDSHFDYEMDDPTFYNAVNAIARLAGCDREDMLVEPDDDGAMLKTVEVTKGIASDDPVDNRGRYRVVLVDRGTELLWTNDLSLDEATKHADECVENLSVEEVASGMTFRIEEDV